MAEKFKDEIEGGFEMRYFAYVVFSLIINYSDTVTSLMFADGVHDTTYDTPTVTSLIFMMERVSLYLWMQS